MAQLPGVTNSPTSPYGNSPQNLTPNTPQDPMAALLAAAASKPAPDIAAAPSAASGQAAAQDPMAALLAGAAPQEVAPPVDPNAPAAAPTDGTQPIDENGASFLQQARASLAANDTEKLGFLKQQFGEGNARMGESGKLEYRKAPGEKFRKFNTTVINDFIDSLIPSARDVVKESVSSTGMAVGGIMGALSSAPTAGISAPVAVPAGALMGRVAAVGLANNLADTVAQWAGIPQDGSRNKLMEQTIETAIESTLPVVGKIFAGGVKKVAGKIPGSTTYVKEAFEAAKKDVYTLTEQSKELIGSLDVLKQAGFSAEILNSQINTNSKPLQDAVARVKNTPEIQNAMVRIGENANKVIKDTLSSVVDAKKAASSTGQIGEQVLSAARTLRSAEGQAIGQFKQKALENTKNGQLPVPENILQNVRSMSQVLGFNPTTGAPPKDLRPLAGQLGLAQSDVPAFVNAIAELNKRGKGGVVRYSDLDSVVKTVGNLSDTAKKYGSSDINKQWNTLAKDMRVFKNEAIEAGLDNETDRLAFRSTNAKYGQLLENVGNIEKLVNDDMGSNIVVDQLLGKGKEALGNAQALKSILPAPTWEKLKSDWFEKRIYETTNTASGKINPAKLSDVFTDLGPEFTNLMFDGNQKKLGTFRAALNYGNRVAQTELPVSGAIPKDQLEKAADAAVTGIIGSAFLTGKAMLGVVFGARAGKKDQAAITTLLGDEGFRRYVSGLPEGKKNIVSRKVDEMYDYAVTHNLMPAAKSIQEATGRIGTQELRGYLGQTGEQPQYQDPAAGQ